MISLHIRKRIFVILVTGTLLIGTTVRAADDAPFSKITFISRQDQVETLHVIDPATGEDDTLPLAADTVSWGLPVWSPTCDRIITDENRGDQKVLGIVAYGENGLSADLPEITPLKDILAYAPRWSPDGNSIAFQALNWTNLKNNTDIYTLSFSTGELKNLTNDPLQNVAPSWSPDGKQIVFSAIPVEKKPQDQEYSDIYVVNADGSSTKALYIDPDTDDFGPLWSPDGNSIVFISQKNIDDDRLLLIGKTGGTPISLIDNENYHIGHYSWSHDSKYIVFDALDSRNTNGDIQIYLLDVSSKSVELLTDVPKTLNRFASWSPDDTQIVFQSTRDGELEIYTLDVATKAVAQLTNNDYKDFYPVWSPQSCADTGYVYQGGVFDLNCPTCRVPTATP